MQSPERRTAERSRSFMSSRIVYNHGQLSIDAVVRNVSADGARLKGDNFLGVPVEFDLLIGSGENQVSSHRARRVWARDDAMGVAFIGAATAHASGRAL